MAELREALEAAYDKHTEEDETLAPSGETGGSEADTSQPVGDSSSEASVSGSDTPTLAPEPGTKPQGDKNVLADAGKNKVAADQRQDENAGVDRSIKAPSSWKPAIRQHWDKLPTEVKQEVLRRETEVQRGLTLSGDARKFSEEFNNVVRPFESIIRSQNSTPIAAVRNLMTTAAGLTLGSPVQRANIVAEIIQNYGVDIETLDQVLSGKVPTSPASRGGPDPSVQQYIQQALAPVQQFMSSAQQRVQAQEQNLAAVAEAAVEDFGGDKEFLDDLADDMADILERAAGRNRPMTLNQAYDLAARSHPEIAPLYAKLTNARAPQQNGDKINRARQAASSIRQGGPSGSGVAPPTDLRGAISAAVDKHWR